MLVIKSEYDFEIVEERKLKEKPTRKKSINIKTFVTKNIENLNRKSKHVHFDSLSLASVKRTIRKFCDKLKIKSRHCGYDKFLTDEEKRCLDIICDSYLVEGM